jgi:hypothetical protein
LQADPGEQHNLATERPEEVNRLQAVLTRKKQLAASSAVVGEQVVLDTETEEQLGNLGY